MTPREEFCLKHNQARAYDRAFLDIGFGVTISGPHLVGRMTSSIDVKRGEKVLEVGTGSGYQSAYLSNLTDKVWTIEIIKPLAERTRRVYDALIARGYTEYKAITTKNADGYYGWEEAAPFDKIIVTCGIDHVPPPLLQQLKPGGIMVIPGRPARRAARPEGREAAGFRRQFDRRPLGHLSRLGSCRSCRSPSSTVDWNAAPPMDSRADFIDWMVKNRGEDPAFLGQRFDRFLQLIGHHDVWDKRNKRAYLMTPREEFVTKPNLGRAYEWHYLDIGYGVTITGPHTVARMTNSIDVQARATRCSRSAPAPATSRPISPTSPTRSGRSRSSSRWPSARAASTTR